MTTVSLPSRVWAKKLHKFGTIFVKNVFWGILGEAVAPLSLPGYAYVTWACVHPPLVMVDLGISRDSESFWL